MLEDKLIRFGDRLAPGEHEAWRALVTRAAEAGLEAEAGVIAPSLFTGEATEDVVAERLGRATGIIVQGRPTPGGVKSIGPKQDDPRGLIGPKPEDPRGLIGPKPEDPRGLIGPKPEDPRGL
ncbi:MAG: hypothetical protein IT385_20770, partial [Deltaproteobacteria bacterium]|nr:hypothetical protein [Deltaproteobacteria bacterium]